MRRITGVLFPDGRANILQSDTPFVLDDRAPRGGFADNHQFLDTGKCSGFVFGCEWDIPVSSFWIESRSRSYVATKSLEGVWRELHRQTSLTAYQFGGGR